VCLLIWSECFLPSIQDMMSFCELWFFIFGDNACWCGQVNLQGEKILQLSEENGQLQTEIHYMKCNLQNAEHRLQAGHSLIQQAESEVLKFLLSLFCWGAEIWGGTSLCLNLGNLISI
jgi:hypothetical protein